MNVFLSWSGDRSQKVASLLSEWLGCVIQAARPWVSSRDIDRGTLWFGEISDQLRDTAVGVICLTMENKERPWILFEAGALAKGLSNSRVCTLLIDLKSSDIKDPLAQFNHTAADKEGIFSLVRTLNKAMGSSGVDERFLPRILETYWPQFEANFREILSTTETAPAPKPRSEKDMLLEILEQTRALNNRVKALEQGDSRTTATHYFVESAMRNKLADTTMSTVRKALTTDVLDGLPKEVIVEKYSDILGKRVFDLFYGEAASRNPISAPKENL